MNPRTSRTSTTSTSTRTRSTFTTTDGSRLAVRRHGPRVRTPDLTVVSTRTLVREVRAA